MKIPLSENEFSLLVGLSLCHDPIHDFKMQTKVINDKETMTKILGIDYLLNEREEEYYEDQQGGKLIPSQKPSLLKSEVKFDKKHKSRDKLDEKINESAYPLLFYLGLLTNDDINSIKSTVKDTNDLQYVKDKIISKIIEKAKIVNQEKAKGRKKKKTFKKKNLKKQKTKKKLTKRKQKRIKKTKTKKNFKGGVNKSNGEKRDYKEGIRILKVNMENFQKYEGEAEKDYWVEIEKLLENDLKSSIKKVGDYLIELSKDKKDISKILLNKFIDELLTNDDDIYKYEDLGTNKQINDEVEKLRKRFEPKSKGKEKMKPDAGPSGEAPAEAPPPPPPPPPPAPEAAPEIVAEIKDEYDSEDDESEEETEEEKELRLQIEQARIEADKDKEAEQTLKMRDVERIKYTSKEASKFAYKHIGLQSHDQKSIKNYTVQQIKDLIQKISTKDEIIEVVSKDDELSKLKNDAKKPLTVIEILEKSTSSISSIFIMLEKNRGIYLRKLAELLVKKKIEEDYRELQLPFIVEEEDEKELRKRIKENEELVSFKAPARLLSIGNHKIMQLFNTIFDIIDISKIKETPLYELLEHEKNIFHSLLGKSFKFKMELTGDTKSWTGKDEVAQPNADEALKLYFVLTYLKQIGVDLTDLDTKTLRSKSGFLPEEILRKYNGKRVIINNGALPFASTTPYNGELMKHAIGSITSSIDSAAGGATGGMKYNFEPYERGNLIVEFNCNDKYFRISLLDKGIIDGVFNCELFIEFKFENNGIILEVSEEKGNVKKTKINKKGILDLNKAYQNMLDDITHHIAKQIVFKRDVPFQWENLFDDAEFLETFIQSYNLKGLGDLLIELTSSLNNGGYEGEIIYGGEDEARIEKFDEKGNAPRLYIAHDWPSAIRYMLFKTNLEDKYKNILSEGGYFESRIDKQNNAYLASLLI
jgi:hypothetical protein